MKLPLRTHFEHATHLVGACCNAHDKAQGIAVTRPCDLKLRSLRPDGMHKTDHWPLLALQNLISQGRAAAQLCSRSGRLICRLADSAGEFAAQQDLRVVATAIHSTNFW